MKARTILIASLLCNAVLLGSALYLAGHRAVSTPRTISQILSAAPLPKTNSSAAKPFNWQQVESEDYKTFIANLRAIGCPEETIRDIVIADVDKLFAARERAVLGTDEWKYWRANDPLPDSISREHQAQLAALHEQKRAVIRALLGIELEDELAKYNDGAKEISHLDFLSVQKRAQILAILNRFKEAKRRIYAEAERLGVGPNWKQLKAAYAQRETELAGVLSADELRAYEVRHDETADNLRRSLVSFEPTEAEFRSLFQLLKTHEDKFSYINPDEEYRQEQKAQDRAAVEAQIKNLLGDARYADYQRASNPQFQELFRLTQQYDLPSDTAATIFDKHQQMQNELSQSSSLTPDQRQEQLNQMQSEMDSLLRNRLGDKAYAALQARGIEHWLGK